jgi:hypothetical protein
MGLDCDEKADVSSLCLSRRADREETAAQISRR